MVVAVVAYTATLQLLAQAGDAQNSSEKVFSSQQARRGKVLYTKHCVSCHQTDLSGSETAPALAGDVFLSHWSSSTVGDLFDRIRTTMPQTDPAGLTRNEYLDIVTYLLESNDYPSGERDLEDTPEALNSIRIK